MQNRIIQRIMRNMQQYDEDGVLGRLKVTNEKNKDGIYLYYIKETIKERKYEPSKWENTVVYHAFDDKGHYVAYVGVQTSSPTNAKIAYSCESEYRNKGNVTLIAKEAIKDIFENNMFDGLKTTSPTNLSSIDTLVAGIGPDNYPSKRVAEKLGFNSSGFLTKEEYYQQKEETKTK